MQWHFTQTDHDSRNVTDPTTLTVQSHGDLTPLEILVREVLQNSLDNFASRPVRVDFRLRYLRGAAKDEFLEKLRFEEQILPHLRAVVQYEKRSRGASEFPEPNQLLKKDITLRLLYIEDFNTRGLIGPEHSLEADQFPKPHCFLGLCRNVGDSQKSEEAMGGIYGLGKTVLWKHSRHRIVLFHSRLQIPYVTKELPGEHRARFFGHIRLPGHDIQQQSFQGEAFFGRRKEQLTWSLMDQEADRLAREFGMAARNANQTGTSILVVDFEDPDSENAATESESLQRIHDAAEQYFWPAMIEGSLEVRTKADSGSDTGWKTRDITDQPKHLKPFLRAYINAYKDKEALSKIEVNVPKGPKEEEKCAANVAVSVLLDHEGMKGPLLNRTALIRGAGMVVGYQRIGRPGLGGKDFYAVVLGGKSCPAHLAAAVREQARCEQLIAYSEPVTHDTWTPQSDKLKRWRGARAEIDRILRSIRSAITEATTSDLRPEGRAISLLSSYFPIAHGTESESARDTKLEFLSDPAIHPDEEGELRYRFHIRVTVPARQDFIGWIPKRWKVECHYGFYGEDVHRKVVESATVGFTHIKRNGSGWDLLSKFDRSFEEEVGEHPLVYEFRGETAPLETFLARTTKQELEIKVLKE
ncbi:hypothetical protein L0222_09480 [bacterium]|nr:hypothetical protein [bacterium]MCI0603081.1 hypothetical protein [bacterium]